MRFKPLLIIVAVILSDALSPGRLETHVSDVLKTICNLNLDPGIPRPRERSLAALRVVGSL